MDIVIYPHESLKIACNSVESFDQTLADLVDSMAIAMYSERGVGIAAPQVGVAKNIILVDPSGGDKSLELKVLVNPKILWTSKEVVRLSEGCLSIPDVIVAIERPVWVEVEYQDLTGKKITEKYGSWKSRIVQHEIDHLFGRLMLDHVEAAPRSFVMRNYPKIRSKRGT